MQRRTSSSSEFIFEPTASGLNFEGLTPVVWPSAQDQLDRYEIARPVVLQETEIEQRLAKLEVPDEVPRRAVHWQAYFQGGAAIRALSDFAHDTFVPEVVTEYVPSSMMLDSPVGKPPARCMRPEDRRTFLEQAASLIMQVGTMACVGDQRTDKAYLLRARNITGLSIALVHGYLDGSGRAARASGGIIYDGTACTKKLLYLGSHDGGRAGRYEPSRFLADTDGPEVVIEKAASLDIPLHNHDEYRQATRHYFSSPQPDDSDWVYS